MTGQFTDNTAKSRFEYHVGDKNVIANYRLKNDTLYIDLVEADPELRGKGAAGQLMQHIVDKAQQDGLAITPICGYAAAWLRKNGY